jgi:hypothetical protein
MSQPAPDQEVETLLKQLASPNEKDRISAVRKLGALSAREPRVIAALEELAAREPYSSVVEQVGTTLRSLGHPHPVWESQKSSSSPAYEKSYATIRERTFDLLIGFVGWSAINSLIWMILRSGDCSYGCIGFNLLLFPINLVILIVLAFARRWLAMGMLIAIAINFAIALAMGALLNALCAIPFFVK